MDEDKWFGVNKAGVKLIKNDTNFFAKSRNTLVNKIRNDLSEIGLPDLTVEEIFIYPNRGGRDQSFQPNAVKVAGTNIFIEEEVAILENIKKSELDS